VKGGKAEGRKAKNWNALKGLVRNKGSSPYGWINNKKDGTAEGQTLPFNVQQFSLRPFCLSALPPFRPFNHLTQRNALQSIPDVSQVMLSMPRIEHDGLAQFLHPVVFGMNKTLVPIRFLHCLH
jgi:hypothetical protein